MEDILKIQHIINVIKSKIEAHNEFKKTYDKHLAFDFNLLNFFEIGENKLSEIYAIFLIPNKIMGKQIL
jgi:hypothetical protein